MSIPNLRSLRAASVHVLANAAPLMPLGDFPGSTPAFDCDVLLGHVLGKSRAWILGHSDFVISEAEAANFNELITRRALGEPVAYLVGSIEFYGRDFLVDNRVLIPRPETELLLERTVVAVERSSGDICVVDVGTGSGAIAISLWAELHKKGADTARLEIVGVDISSAALSLAEQNAARIAQEIAVSPRALAFEQNDLLDDSTVSDSLFARMRDKERAVLVAANLPYIADNEPLPIGVKDFEPKLALFGGSDGLDLIRRLVTQCAQNEVAWIGLEVGYQQAQAVAEMLEQNGFVNIQTTKDLAGIARVVEGTRK